MIILIFITALSLAILISLTSIVVGMSFKLNDIEESLDIILHKLTKKELICKK